VGAFLFDVKERCERRGGGARAFAGRGRKVRARAERHREPPSSSPRRLAGSLAAELLIETRVVEQDVLHAVPNYVRRSSAVKRLAAVESHVLECTDLRSNPTMRRGPRRRLVEREQKAESHLVTTLWERYFSAERVNGFEPRTIRNL
jgi:hypothetical protein